MGIETRAKKPDLWIVHRCKASILFLALIAIIGTIYYRIIKLIVDGIIKNSSRIGMLTVSNIILTVFTMKGIYPHTPLAKKNNFTGVNVLSH